MWHGSSEARGRLLRRWGFVVLGFVSVVFAEGVHACVDLNAATPAALTGIVHVDPTRAEAIVAGRPWAAVRDLTRVRGLGVSRVLDIEAQNLACVGDAVPAGTRPHVMGRVVVVDGDTLRSADETVRLIGIDAPEKGQSCEHDGRTWPCGQEAVASLRALVAGRDVDCEVFGRDRYQRALAVCFVDGADLNAAMVREGWALAWYPARGAVLGPDYTEDEVAAAAASLGMWIGQFTAPWEWRR